MERHGITDHRCAGGGELAAIQYPGKNIVVDLVGEKTQTGSQ